MPVILLAGGYDKGTPFEESGQVIQRRAKVALVYGKTAAQLAQAIAQAARRTSRPTATGCPTPEPGCCRTTGGSPGGTWRRRAAVTGLCEL